MVNHLFFLVDLFDLNAMERRLLDVADGRRLDEIERQVAANVDLIATMERRLSDLRSDRLQQQQLVAFLEQSVESGEERPFFYTAIENLALGDLAQQVQGLYVDEAEVLDFALTATLPHNHSQYGPGLAVGDVDGNGLFGDAGDFEGWYDGSVADPILDFADAATASLRRWAQAGVPGDLQPLEDPASSEFTGLQPKPEGGLCYPIPDSERETNPNVGG